MKSAVPLPRDNIGSPHLRHPSFLIHHGRLILILVLALALRLALWSQPLHEPANDEIEYITVARDLLAGRGWSFYSHYHWLRAPLYPLFLAGSLWLAGGNLHHAALPTILLSVANVALTYALTRRLAGPRAAMVGALLSAILWTYATFASLYMAETLFTCLFQAAFLLTLQTPASHRPALVALAAGAFFGLAALTRSALLPFLPLAALWLALASYPNARTKGHRRPLARILAPASLLVAIALVIAPWTIRNTLVYSRPILIETGLSYNLWAFNEPREDLDTIKRTLERIANPAERSDYATARGIERIREDPTILARKLWPNWVFLARVKPIQDRFLMESYYDSVDLPLFMAALIFDDALYMLIALAAIYGFVHSAGSPDRSSWFAYPRSLALLWLAITIGTILITHGEARYRHFLFPLLIPYAAWALTARSRPHLPGTPAPKPHSAPRTQRFGHLFRLHVPSCAFVDGDGGIRSWRSTRQSRTLITIVLWSIMLWTVVTSYPRDWAAENLARGWHTAVGDLARMFGRPDAAIDAYARAADAQSVPDPLLRLGDTARQAGDPQRALDAYRKARRLIPIYEPTAARLGDLLREQGDLTNAQAAFDAPSLEQQRLVDWSWRHLRPVARSEVLVGDGLDYGYIGGVYPAEQIQGVSARWSGSRAWLRLHAATPGQSILILRLAAPHPGLNQVPVEICIAGRCRTIAAQPGWRTYRVPVEATGETVIELRVRPFQAPDGRMLGILLSTAGLTR